MGKKILIVGHAYIVPANRRVWSLMGREHRVDLLIPEKWKSNLVGDIKYKAVEDDKSLNSVFKLPTLFRGNGSFYFYCLLRTFKILLTTKYDLIVMNQESWSLSLTVFNFIRRLTKNKSTFTELIVAQNIKKEKLRFLIPLEKLNLRTVNKVLGCCYETKKVYDWKGIPVDWGYLPLYYNDKTVSFVSKYKDDEKKSIKLGYLGRISEEKGISDLLEAFRTLKLKHNVELVLAGNGPMLSEVESCGGVDYRGVLAHNDVGRFYKDIDLFILPSRTTEFWKEQFGRVIVESVMSGVLIAGSDSGAIPEVIKTLGLDYIFEERNPESIVKIIELFIKSNEETKIQKITEAMSKCQENFSEDKYAQRVLEYANL